MRGKYFCLLLMATLLFSMRMKAKAPENAESILGKWTNEEKTRVLEFSKKGNSYEAVIVQANDEQMVGKKQVTDLQFKNGMYHGTLFLPKRQQSYPCTIKLISTDVMEITASAGMMRKSQKWLRVKP